VILKAAIAHAAFEGRDAIHELDILMAAELALPHRLRRKPFEETQGQMQKLERRLEQARAEVSAAQENGEGEGEQVESKKKRTP
jgi:Mg-chelatase subunit ChlI